MAYQSLNGMSVISSADLADIDSDANAVYPNGIGKREGMKVYRDTGSILEVYMAQGAATDAVWSRQTETTLADVTPS